MTRNAALSVGLLGLSVAFGAARPAPAADGPTEVRGEAILVHPAGKVALKAAELLAAGKIEDAIRLRSALDQAEWKRESAADRQELTARMKDRAPDPKAFERAVRKAGVLTIYGANAVLEAPYGAGEEVTAIFKLEKGKWYPSTGPMVLPGAADPAKETRLSGAEIAGHPVYGVALAYADALHSGTADAFLKLASSQAQADWKALPPSERSESTAYRKKTLPKRKELAAGIETGGVLIVEDDARATLNVVTVEQRSTQPGTVQSTSTTVAVPFVLEGGQWKLAR